MADEHRVRHRRSYTLAKKYSIVQEHQRGVPGSGIQALSRTHDIPERTIRGWIADAPNIEAAIRKRDRRRRSGGGAKPSLPDLEDRLEQWVAGKNTEGRRIQGADLQAEAKRLHEADGNDASFKFSRGWMQRFKRRKGLTCRRATTTRSLPPETAEIASNWIRDVRALIEEKGVKRQNILNMDQVPRYFQSEAAQTVAKKGARQILLKKPSSSHKRFTATFTIGADGVLHKPHLLFSKRKTKPAVDEGVHVAVNDSGMWNSQILSDYVRDIVLSRPETALEGEPTLLLIDSYAAHVRLSRDEDGALQRSNVFVRIIPPNTTSILQPLDVVMNRSFQSSFAQSFEAYMTAAENDPTLKTPAGNVKMPTPKLCSEWVVDWAVGVDPQMVKRAFDVVGLNDGPLQVDALHPVLRDILGESEIQANVEMPVDDRDVFEEDAEPSTLEADLLAMSESSSDVGETSD